MNRILKLLVTVGVFFVARRFFTTGTSGGSDASHVGAGAAQSSPRGLITQKFVALLQSVGDGQLSPHDVRLVSIAIFVYSFAVGFLADLLLGDRAFGRGFNGLIALLGAGLAMTGLSWFAPEMREYGIGLMVGATVLSSLLFLGAAIALKVFVASEIKGFASGAGTRTGEAVKTLRGASSTNQVSQERIQRALRRP